MKFYFMKNELCASSWNIFLRNRLCAWKPAIIPTNWPRSQFRSRPRRYRRNTMPRLSPNGWRRPGRARSSRARQGARQPARGGVFVRHRVGGAAEVRRRRRPYAAGLVPRHLWLFKETLAYRDRLVAHLGLTDVRTIAPSPSALALREPSAICASATATPAAASARSSRRPRAGGFRRLDQWPQAHHGGARAALAAVETRRAAAEVQSAGAHE